MELAVEEVIRSENRQLPEDLANTIDEQKRTMAELSKLLLNDDSPRVNFYIWFCTQNLLGANSLNGPHKKAWGSLPTCLALISIRN